MNGKSLAVAAFAACLTAIAGVGLSGSYDRDFTTGTAGSVSSAACGVQCAAVAKSEMQSAVQKILDDAVASGAQSACQCCVYIDGKLVVDAWAGTMATNSAEKIDGSSLFPIFSTEKAQFVTAVHIAHERGKFDYEAKIRDYWPEFRGGNKDELTVRQLLGMRTGLPGVPPRQATDDQLCDWNFMTDWCARSETKHPGRPGYLGRTWGWYLGKVLENVYGRPINDVLTDEVLKPCGIENDYYFAVPDSELKRVVTVYNGKENYNFEEMNKNCCRKACVPSSFAVANARAIAKFYLRLSGQDGKPPLIKRETLMNALKVNRADDDPLPDAETLRKNWQTVWGLGYTMWGERDELDRIMGSGGLGGSEGFCDLKNRICIGYTCAISATATGKPWDIRPDIYHVVGIRTRYVNAAKSTPAQRTMCNPLPIEDYPLGVHCRGLANGSKSARDSETWLTPDGTTRQFRELADPALLCAGKSWYLYPSAEMCYRSDDGGASWKHISLHMSGSDGDADLVDYAPTVVAHRGEYLLAGSNGFVFRSKSPEGPFERLGHLDLPEGEIDGEQIPPFWDPCLFSDDDERLYLYWGCTPTNGIWGCELDASNPLKVVSAPKKLIAFEPDTQPWEIAPNKKPLAAYLEGAWMVKHDGKYILVYSAAGTENREYAMGQAVGTSPLGVFVKPKDNPFLRKATGLVTGTSHGALAKGPDGGYWVVYTIRASTVHWFERRIGMDRIRFNADGSIAAMSPSEAPQFAAGAGVGGPGWKRLSGKVPSDAVSAVDDDLSTFWTVSKLPDELVVDFGGPKVVRAFRLIWRDGGLDTERGVKRGPFRYRIEAQDADGSWQILVDASANSRDLLVDYRETPAVKTRSVRLIVLGGPKGIVPQVVDFSLFGE